MTAYADLTNDELQGEAVAVVREIESRLTGPRLRRWRRIHALIRDFEEDIHADGGISTLSVGGGKDVPPPPVP
jgi:hypothetical protein